jgi:Cysteine dioxygenase type I
MRPANLPGPPVATTAVWSEADLVELTLRLASGSAQVHLAMEATPADLESELSPGHLTAEAALARTPADRAAQPTPPDAGPLSGRVADRGESVLRSSTAPVDGGGSAAWPAASAGRPWSVPLLLTPEVEAWLLGWPAGMVTPAHGHGRSTAALTVVEGSLGEECLDPTIWTTARRTTWRAGASTLFTTGHVHVLGAAGDRPAVAVHAWSRPAGSGDRGAGRLARGGRGTAAGRDPGRGRGRTEAVGVGPGRGGHACLAGHAAHGALDLGHVRDRVAG